MSNEGIDALASHYHRYAKWTVKTSVSNVHGDIRTFYSGMLTKDNVDKVEQSYINTYYQHKILFSFFSTHAPPQNFPVRLFFFRKYKCFQRERHCVAVLSLKRLCPIRPGSLNSCSRNDGQSEQELEVRLSLG